MKRLARLAGGGALALVLAVSVSACGQGDDAGAKARPTIDDVTAETRTLVPGGEAEVSVVASDPDSNESEPGGLGPELEAEWRVSGEGWSVEGDGRVVSVSAPDRYRSWTAVTVEVTDASGASESAQIELKTGENALPKIAGLEAVPNPVAPAGTAQLRASAEDPRGDDLSYAWSAPEDWSLEEKEGREVELQAPDRESARGRVTATITDEFGGEVERTVLVETGEDAPPRINSMSASPPQVEPGGTTELDVDASDPEESDLSYAWTASGDWTVDGSGAGATAEAPEVYGERGRVEVEVTDERDQSTTGRVSVSTESNEGPIIQGLYANRRQADPGETLRVTVNASDPNGDSLSYDWQIDGSDWAIKPNGDRATVTVSDQPGESTTVTVDVEDEVGETASASILVSVAPNLAPQIAAVTANPRSVDPGGSSKLEASASDPEGDDLSYEWNVASPWSIDGSGRRVTLEAPGTFGEQAIVRLKVEDESGGADRDSIRVSTRSNGDPIINSMSANPTIVSTGGTSRVEVSASDPDGDSLGYQWSVPKRWSKSTTSKPNAVDVSAPKQANASGPVSVTVTDGNGGTSRGSVVIRTPLDKPPNVTKLTAKKTKLKPNATTKISSTVTDPEGDPISYGWNLPKGWKGSSSGDSIVVTAPRAYGKSFDIELKASDGQSTTTETITLRTVANKPPTITSFSVSSAIKAGGSAKATVSASDPLGDQLSYSWKVANKQWGISGSGKTVTIDAPNKKTSSTVTAIVEDGFGGRVTKQTTVKSRNALFSFSSHRFTHCGSSGGRGPQESSCENAYSPKWASNDQYYWMDDRGIQKWRVPQNGKYRIVAAGAEGGGDRNDEGVPGEGATIEGTFQLSKGDVLQILVGQKGETSKKRSHPFGAGGGGTFVTDASHSPLIVAGGGSGSNGPCDGNPGRGDVNASDDDGSDLGSSRCGGAGFSTSNSGDCSLGTISAFTAGGEVLGRGCPKATGGQNNDVCGGFGGGGLVEWHGEGGGGGYHGGRGHDCGGSGRSSSATGGSSYNDGSNQSNQTGGNTGHGYVKIETK